MCPMGLLFHLQGWASDQIGEMYGGSCFILFQNSCNIGFESYGRTFFICLPPSFFSLLPTFIQGHRILLKSVITEFILKRGSLHNCTGHHDEKLEKRELCETGAIPDKRKAARLHSYPKHLHVYV